MDFATMLMKTRDSPSLNKKKSDPGGRKYRRREQEPKERYLSSHLYKNKKKGEKRGNRQRREKALNV